jgi:hypothetical protein
MGAQCASDSGMEKENLISSALLAAHLLVVACIVPQSIARWRFAAVLTIFHQSAFQLRQTGLELANSLAQGCILGFELGYAFRLCHTLI